MPLAYLIGIDVGTSGTKTLLADADGRIAARATVDYPLHAPRRPGPSRTRKTGGTRRWRAFAVY